MENTLLVNQPAIQVLPEIVATTLVVFSEVSIAHLVGSLGFPTPITA